MGEETDFWKFASEPSNLWKLKVIAEGAKRFADWLRGTQDWIRNVEAEAYPFDTFTVLVHFVDHEGRQFSINLEEISIRDNTFDAVARIYAWREDAAGHRHSLLGEDVMVEEGTRRTVEIGVEEIEAVFREIFSGFMRSIMPRIRGLSRWTV